MTNYPRPPEKATPSNHLNEKKKKRQKLLEEVRARRAKWLAKRGSTGTT